MHLEAARPSRKSIAGTLYSIIVRALQSVYMIRRVDSAPEWTTHSTSVLNRVIPIPIRRWDDERLKLFGKGLGARFQCAGQWLQIKG